ncbi:MAG TPA: GNAT family N-acetyltransferase [Terracidiphilus sp.]
MTIHRVLTSAQPEFHALLGIYTQAHPESERKSLASLSAMIARPECFFLAALHHGAVVGFTISNCFLDSDAALLEYMAVAVDHRNRGIGKSLFQATVNFPALAPRTVLIEVDSNLVAAPDAADCTRRKAFYRSLGCREIERLSFLMPRVSSTLPPPMELLVYRNRLPQSIEKARLLRWLRDCYVQVYQAPPNDPRIDAMLSPLPDTIRLL